MLQKRIAQVDSWLEAVSSLVAIVKTTGGCQAILHDLEPE
jgi:hypothetical protein